MTSVLSNALDSLTVFAPTDAAFSALPRGLLVELLRNPTAALRDVVSYHVAPSTFFALGLTDGLSIATAYTDALTIATSLNGTSGLFVNGYQITITDIMRRYPSYFLSFLIIERFGEIVPIPYPHLFSLQALFPLSTILSAPSCFFEFLSSFISSIAFSKNCL